MPAPERRARPILSVNVIYCYRPKHTLFYVVLLETKILNTRRCCQQRAVLARTPAAQPRLLTRIQRHQPGCLNLVAINSCLTALSQTQVDTTGVLSTARLGQPGSINLVDAVPRLMATAVACTWFVEHRGYFRRTSLSQMWGVQ